VGLEVDGLAWAARILAKDKPLATKSKGTISNVPLKAQENFSQLFQYSSAALKRPLSNLTPNRYSKGAHAQVG
jgi:hypothetical protein